MQAPTKPTRKYALRRQEYDKRDHAYSDAYQPALKLPIRTDLRSLAPPAWDQGTVGTCHAEMTCAAMCVARGQAGLPYLDPSVLFSAYTTRALEGHANEDSGATIRSTFKAAAAFGVCSSETWPYIVARLCVRPTPKSYAEAKLHEAIQYQFLSQSAAELRGALANGHVWGFGITVYESFESAQVARTGLVPMPKPTEQALGGHALLCVGYDDLRARFLIRNSWGTGWGIDGHCWMPYSYILNPNLAFNHGTIQRAT